MEYYKARSSNYGTVGLEVLISVLMGFGLGHWLDGRLASEPYLAIVGFVFGVATAIRFLVRAAARMKAETEKDDFREADVGRSARYRMDNKRRR